MPKVSHALAVLAIGIIFMFLPVMLLHGCRDVSKPDTTVGKLVHCGTAAVQENWPRILPSVNSCLTDQTERSYEPCLISLINPVAGITEDVLACVLRDQGGKFAASAETNPGDTRSMRASVRAQAFINRYRYQFAE